MFTELRIGGFKAFYDEQTVPIRPITLLFGENGSGKSSVLHAIAFLRELHARGKWDVAKVTLGGTEVDMGSLNDYACNHDKTSLGVSIPASDFMDPADIWKPSIPVNIDVSTAWRELASMEDQTVKGCPKVVVSLGAERIAHLERSPDWTSYYGGSPEHILKSIGLIDTIKETVRASLLELMVPDLDSALESSWPGLLHYLRAPGGSLIPASVFPAPSDDLLGFINRHSDALKPEVSPGQLWDALFRISTAINRVLSAVSNELGRQLFRFHYLGPYREPPPRLLHDRLADARALLNWGGLRRGGGLKAVNDWLTDANKLNTGFRLLRQDYVDPKWLAAMAEVSLDGADTEEMSFEDMVETILEDELDEWESHERFIAILIENVLTGARSSIRDVGFGISQILPIVVAAVNREQHLIAVEQPELHIHPALQARMGDLFIDSACGARKNTFLLETHSEHLMLRILRRIREGAEGKQPEGLPLVTPEDVAVLYVERTAEGATIREIRIDADGEFIDPWPHGFFPERSDELF